jgi:hypothetical protein
MVKTYLKLSIYDLLNLGLPAGLSEEVAIKED